MRSLSKVDIVLANQMYIAKKDLPPGLLTRLVRIAAFQNPEFYSAQAMRFSTFGKPRIISCAQDFQEHIGLPRGCTEEATEVLNSLGIRLQVDDKREAGTEAGCCFRGKLDVRQEEAVSKLLRHEIGILAAPTAFGKTVVAARMIAERGRNALVVVHRRQLLEQWLERLATFLDIDPLQLGRIGGGKRQPTGVVDVALIQSLIRRGEVSDLVRGYGHLIVDECHHLSAVSFEAVARAAHAKFVLGLTATATRKDGHHPIVFMQCGQIRHRIAARKQADERPFSHQVIRSFLGLLRLKLVVVLDLFSRFPLAFKVFLKEPSSVEMLGVFDQAFRKFGRPRHFVSDQESQFTAQVFRETLAALGIKQRFGAIGQYGSIAIIERFWRTLKELLGVKLFPPLNAAQLEAKLGISLTYLFRPSTSSGSGWRDTVGGLLR
ncbi:MAG: DEAD/DEAH box helicase family protein [Thermoanaerobaculales bacterium]|nr:DEAD/DEAH box helicase family protein [Thermoanaerobaculales bacterium]